MFGLGDELRPPPVVTFVLRLWRAGGMREPAAFRYQTTHVQTGDVAYFGTIDSVMHHVQRLTEQLLSDCKKTTSGFCQPSSGRDGMRVV